MKYFFLVMCAITLCNKISAQDSIQVSPEQLSRGLANQFSQTRVLDIQYNMVGTRNIKSELLGTNLEEKSIDATQDLDININIPLIKKQRWQLTYSGQYHYTNYPFNDFNEQNIQDDFHYFNSAISVTYFTRLLKKSVIYNTSFILDASDEIFGRARGLASATLVLKKDVKKSMTVGLVAIIDPTANIPIIPTFSYSTPIFNRKWKLDMVLPSHIMLRTPLGRTGRLSFGTELESSRFYLKIYELQNNTNDLELRQTGLRSGVTYECLIKQKIVFTAKLGIDNVIQSRISEKGERFNNDNYLVDLEPEASGFFNIGVSFNPFKVKKSK